MDAHEYTPWLCEEQPPSVQGSSSPQALPCRGAHPFLNIVQHHARQAVHVTSHLGKPPSLPAWLGLTRLA